MNDVEYVDEGIKREVEIDGVNYYVIVTRSSVMMKHPYENRAEHWEVTKRVNRICEVITETLEMLNYKKYEEGIWWEDDEHDIIPEQDLESALYDD